MATKVIQIFFEDGWLYALSDDGSIARKFFGFGGSEWEEIEKPNKVVKPKQKNARA